MIDFFIQGVLEKFSLQKENFRFKVSNLLKFILSFCILKIPIFNFRCSSYSSDFSAFCSFDFFPSNRLYFFLETIKGRNYGTDKL